MVGGACTPLLEVLGDRLGLAVADLRIEHAAPGDKAGA